MWQLRVRNVGSIGGQDSQSKHARIRLTGLWEYWTNSSQTDGRNGRSGRRGNFFFRRRAKNEQEKTAAKNLYWHGIGAKDWSSDQFCHATPGSISMSRFDRIPCNPCKNQVTAISLPSFRPCSCTYWGILKDFCGGLVNSWCSANKREKSPCGHRNTRSRSLYSFWGQIFKALSLNSSGLIFGKFSLNSGSLQFG